MATVLVVDDSPIDRRLAGGILEKSGELKIENAEHGLAALGVLASTPIDLVVTDLQMPEMNGLELVELVRARYPLIPVILMTAHGSEDIAVQALERGAASYVPKANLARDLTETVENVLAVARADRRNDRLRDCLIESETSFALENDPTLIPPLVDYLQDMVIKMRLCDETGRIRVGIALEEALLNGLYHGNLEISTDELREASSELMRGPRENLVEQRRTTSPYRDRRLQVRARVTPEMAEFVIRDDGPGFAHNGAATPESATFDREHGRGLVLMRSFMSDVRFNDTGNEVTLIVRTQQPAG
jgi:CheY-like chemotaxis protein